jgi:hypothetical protein
VSDGLQAPSGVHWLGTDDQGRDVLARVLFGARISLTVAVISVSIGAVVGVSMGMLAGYAGGTVDLLLMRVVDALLAFPALLLAISITAALGPQIQNAMIAIGVVSIPIYARLTRAQVLAVRERDFITAARALGTSPSRIALVHMLPNIANALIVQATLTTAFAILGSGHQLQPALHHQPDVVGQRRARVSHLPGRLCVQLSRRRATRLAGPAIPPTRLAAHHVGDAEARGGCAAQHAVFLARNGGHLPVGPRTVDFDPVTSGR